MLWVHCIDQILPRIVVTTVARQETSVEDAKKDGDTFARANTCYVSSGSDRSAGRLQIETSSKTRDASVRCRNLLTGHDNVRSRESTARSIEAQRQEIIVGTATSTSRVDFSSAQ